MFKKYTESSVTSFVLAGVLVSAVMLPNFSVQSAFAKSSKELLFSSEMNSENAEKELNFKHDSLKSVKQTLEDKKIQVKSINPEDKVDLSEYNSIAYNYKDVEKNKKLQKALQEELQNGKKVYLFGGLTIKEYCDLLGIDKLYTQTKIESGDSQESIELSFFNKEDEKKEKKKKDGTDKNKDSEKHEIIGYTLDEDTPYKVFISDINSYDDEGKIEIEDEIYLSEILQHENKIIEKSDSEISTRSSRIVDSEYDIIASAYYITKKAGQINSQWKLYKVTDEDDTKYDYFYVKDTSTIETYEWLWDAEEFTIRHDLVFDSDELDDAEPNDTSSNPYKVSLGYPYSIGFEYEIDTEPDMDLTLNKSNDYAKWKVTGSQLESSDDYEFVTAWASTGTYTKLDISHKVNFYAGIDVETDADQSISISYNY